MKISLRWLNEYLEPGDLTSEEAQHALTFAGFPIETVEEIDGDVCMDVEVTSNRGDVLSHIGVAREIAATTRRHLKLPAAGKSFDWGGEMGGSAAGKIVSGALAANDIGAVCAVENRVEPICSLFTARVITGVSVGPSPAWLVKALAGAGQRSINNVVDVTNFVALEYGQPTHVFDLDTLQRSPDGKSRVVVRTAAKGEKLTLLDSKVITLVGDETIVGDEGPHGSRVISLAGVMGGLDTEVTGRTVNVLLEAATWAPMSVRRTARRFQIRTDASHRFERIVDPRTIENAARRAAGLIVKVAGGRLIPGVIHAGAQPRPLTSVSLRPSRVSSVLGLPTTPPQIQETLEALEITARPGEGRHGEGSPLVCTIPAHRPDLEREIDLIEEVARVRGLDRLPVLEKLPVRVSSPQGEELAVRELGHVLTGLGFYEAITFTFVSPKMARPFTPSGLKTLEVCDGRRKADPVVRPSALASLLACRRVNQDAGNAPETGRASEMGVRLYEVSSAIGEVPGAVKGARGELVERRNLSMVIDAAWPSGGKSIEQKQTGVRVMRGVIEACVRAMAGSDVRVEMRAGGPIPLAGFDASASAEVVVNGERIGVMGVIAQGVQNEHGLAIPVIGAELSLEALIGMYPPRALAHELPAFPSIERDLSLIVSEATAWSRIESLVSGLRVPLLEEQRFLGVYRGVQAGAGRKSVSMRMRFRDPARTLTHDEVSPQVDTIVAAAKRELGAEVRTT